MKLFSDIPRTPVIFARFTFVSIALLLALAPPAHAFTLTRGLMQGYFGEDVSALQQFLKDRGFYTYPEITGYYGTSTVEAVAAFQKTKGIPPLGGVGPDTRAAINALLAASGQSISTRLDEQALIALYTQLIKLLKQEIASLSSAPIASVSPTVASTTSQNPGIGGLSSAAPSTASTTPSQQPDSLAVYNKNAPGNGWTPGFGGGGGAAAASAAASTPTPAPYVAKAVHFGGSGNYLSNQSVSTSDGPTISYSVWFKSAGGQNNAVLWVVDPLASYADAAYFGSAVETDLAVSNFRTNTSVNPFDSHWHNLIFSAKTNYGNCPDRC